MRRIAFLVCLCAAGGAARGQWLTALAANPSAEADRNADGVPDGWQASAFRSPAKLAWDRAVAHTGAASLRVSGSANPQAKQWDERTGRWISTAKTKVTPGEPYALGVWIRTKGVTGGASACIAWWKGGQWLAESYTPRLTGTSDWRRVTVRAKAPPQADAAQVYLCLSNSGGTAWFDDCLMVAGAELPGNFRPVDLRPLCTAGFRDDKAGDAKGGWTDQGPNDLRGLPTGEVVLRGVPFRLIDSRANEGRSCIVLAGEGTQNRPKRVAVPVGRTCRTLYFLHTCAWATGRKNAGSYELVYDNGEVHVERLIVGEHVADWWTPAEGKKFAVAWEGANPVHKPVAVYVFPLANPQPKLAVKEVRFVSGDEGVVPILLALTTADGPPVLTHRPIRFEVTDKTGWYPFNFPLDDTNRDRIDLTGYLDPPAGKHGFLAVRADGHFYFADGTRGRFFGTNVGGSRAFPAKKDAPVLAARLAKYGVNLLRIHAIDGRWGPLIDYKKGDSRHFDAQALDRLDFFFAELKRRGIYVYFDMLDYRRFLPGDGVPHADEFQHGWQNSIKGVTIYNDRLIELQKEFAEKFFTHRNPYTKLRYVDDPAVAVVEITNENSVFYFRNTKLTLGYYVEELRRRWNRWLLKRHGSRDALAKAWTNALGQCALLADEDPAAGSVFLPMQYLYQDPAEAKFVGRRSPARVNAMVRFFVGLERRYYGEMRATLKRIGIRVPITGTNQTFCPASTYADAVNDFMSRNNYWCHPNVRGKPYVTFRNRAVVRSDLARTMNPVTEIASSTVAGKPMVSPEFNWPWPIEFRAECLPMMAAYACLQEWDGLLFFAYTPGRKALEHFGNQSDPVRWGQFPAAAMIFHRADVSPARHTVHVAWSQEDVFTARPSHGRRSVSPFRYLPYLSKVRNVYFEKAYAGRADAVVAGEHAPPSAYKKARRVLIPAKGGDAVDYRRFAESARKWGLMEYRTFAEIEKRYVSDTGQLALDGGRQTFTIDTPRTKAAVGFLGARGRIELGGVAIECRTPFAAVMVTSVDGEPIGKSRRLLVTAVARAENTGQAFYRNKSAIPHKGRAPVLAEPVRCRLTVPMPAKASVYPLDETGRRRKALEAHLDAGRLHLQTDDAQSPWCEVAAE